MSHSEIRLDRGIINRGDASGIVEENIAFIHKQTVSGHKIMIYETGRTPEVAKKKLETLLGVKKKLIL